MNEEYARIHDNFQRKVNWLRDKQTTKRDWTCVVNLETIHRVQYAIVLAWMDYDNNGDWRLYAKLGYKSIFSLMDEYDIDWTMPYDKRTGEVLCDEIEIGNGYMDFEYLYKAWKALKAIMSDSEMSENIEFGQKTRKVEV